MTAVISALTSCTIEAFIVFRIINLHHIHNIDTPYLDRLLQGFILSYAFKFNNENKNFKKTLIAPKNFCIFNEKTIFSKKAKVLVIHSDNA